jgi:hypothetical protein
MPKDLPDERTRFLWELVKYAEESGTLNPHFYRREMMDRLGLTERAFNVLQKQLGDKYCRFVDCHQGDVRYAIAISECLALRDHLDELETQERRHRQNVRLSVLLVVLSALLGAACALWLAAE